MSVVKEELAILLGSVIEKLTEEEATIALVEIKEAIFLDDAEKAARD